MVDRVFRSSDDSNSDSEEVLDDVLDIEDSVEPPVRSSIRGNKGQHSNINKLPRSTVNSEQSVQGSIVESFYSAIQDLGK